MYSISSQIFEGLTEYVVKSKTQSVEEIDKQKGELFSGRILADIIGNYDNHTEKKFLHDYSYNLFEQKLLASGKVIEITSDNIVDNINNLSKYSFAKITGRAIFNDTLIIEQTLKSFNQLGEAFGTITLHNERKNAEKDVQNQINQIKDKNQKVKATQQVQANISKVFKNYLKESGLNLDPKYLDSLAYILNYGYNGRFEIQIPMILENLDVFFSGLLKREYLTEDEYSIINKYSRETEKEFTIFGIITQIENGKPLGNVNFENQNSEQTVGMKKAIMNIVSALKNVEHTFIGRMDNEYIIDPIAVYREI
jgi:hypothetical protein